MGLVTPKLTPVIRGQSDAFKLSFFMKTRKKWCKSEVRSDQD